MVQCIMMVIWTVDIDNYKSSSIWKLFLENSFIVTSMLINCVVLLPYEHCSVRYVLDGVQCIVIQEVMEFFSLWSFSFQSEFWKKIHVESLQSLGCLWELAKATCFSTRNQLTINKRNIWQSSNPYYLDPLFVTDRGSMKSRRFFKLILSSVAYRLPLRFEIEYCLFLKSDWNLI